MVVGVQVKQHLHQKDFVDPIVRFGCLSCGEGQPPIPIFCRVRGRQETVAMIRHRDVRLDVGICDIVVRRPQIVVLQVLALQKHRVNHLPRSQVDRQVRITIRCLRTCREVAVNDVAGIGSARERHRHTAFQCFPTL